MLQDSNGADIPLQPVERTKPEEMSTLQPMEDSILEQVDISGRALLCGEDPRWTRERRKERQRGAAVMD